jgi:hypothetical protein
VHEGHFPHCQYQTFPAVVAVNIIRYQFGIKFKLVFCAKYDRGLDLGFWEILKPFEMDKYYKLFPD